MTGVSFHNTTSRGHFGNSLAEMDDSVGKLLSAIELSGVANNTLVFFMSDNGYGSCVSDKFT